MLLSQQLKLLLQLHSLGLFVVELLLKLHQHLTSRLGLLTHRRYTLVNVGVVEAYFRS
mgnify:CR=1 FL=1